MDSQLTGPQASWEVPTHTLSSCLPVCVFWVSTESWAYGAPVGYGHGSLE